MITNIYLFSILNFSSPILSDYPDLNYTFLMQTKAALIYDSVYVFAIALQALEQSHKLRISNVSCTAETPWNGGLSLVNYINGVSEHLLFALKT